MKLLSLITFCLLFVKSFIDDVKDVIDVVCVESLDCNALIDVDNPLNDVDIFWVIPEST